MGNTMYRIQYDGSVLPQRFKTEAEAIEYAQKTLKLPPDADWCVERYVEGQRAWK
jgi:hypothetical protein